MNAQEKIVLESLVSKLSSLRKTLSDEERKILDTMVITDLTDEVSLHRFDQEVTPKADSVAMPKIDKRADQAADDEVSLHRFDQEVTPKADSVAMPKIDKRADQAADDEVSLHRFDQEVTPKADSVAMPKIDKRADQAADDEVTLHAAVVGEVKDEAVIPSAAQFKIKFDPKTDNYIINIEDKID